MAISVYPVTPSFAAEIGDLDLAQPLEAADLAAVKAAFATHAVLIFPDQQLTQEQHLGFAALFGPLEVTIGVHRKDAPLRLRQEFADVSNLNHKDKLWGKDSRLRQFQLANRLWHTDSSFKRLPALASLLYARAIPPLGGHTNFADEERRALPPVPQALVRVIPESGRRSLYLASHAGRIFGMPDVEGRALIDDLIEHATQRQFVYTHRWRVNDLVMWDDRCTMHRGTRFDDLRFRRDVQRATVSDVANTCEQEGIGIAAA